LHMMVRGEFKFREEIEASVISVSYRRECLII
jgi:hypothetical protein